MNLTTYFLLMQAARLLPLTIGLLRWKKMDERFRPFTILLALGLINETINYVLILNHRTNVIPFNVFQLVECLGIFYLLYRWEFWKNKPSYFYLLVLGSLLFWIVEKLVFKKILEFTPYYRVFYAFAIVLIILNKIIYIANENTNVFRNAKFIICTGFIIFFIYQILLEGALISNPSLEAQNKNIIIRLLGYMDSLTNLLYAWAMLVVPEKSGFSLKENT